MTEQEKGKGSGRARTSARAATPTSTRHRGAAAKPDQIPPPEPEPAATDTPFYDDSVAKLGRTPGVNEADDEAGAKLREDIGSALRSVQS